jgi:hypothetical protein
MAELTTDPDLRERVREKYAEAARTGSCCGGEAGVSTLREAALSDGP